MGSGLPLLLVSVDTSLLYRWSEGERVKPGCALSPPASGSPRKLAKEGMDSSYHNHELAKYGNKTWLEILYEQASPEQLKVEIDVHWIQAGGGDPVAWIKKAEAVSLYFILKRWWLRKMENSVLQK